MSPLCDSAIKRGVRGTRIFLCYLSVVGDCGSMIIPRIRRLYSTSTRRCYGVHPPRHRLARSLTDADTNDIQLSCISLYFAVAAGNDVTFIPLDPPPPQPLLPRPRLPAVLRPRRPVGRAAHGDGVSEGSRRPFSWNNRSKDSPSACYRLLSRRYIAR